MQNKGQGAIEYLLIIGAAIIVVAVVIIALSGVLNSATEENSQTEYNDAYADLKYEHIGFPISINPGEHISFTLAVQPKNNLLPSIFSDAPIDTNVAVNGSTHQKTLSGWTNQGDTAKINQGDTLDVTVPLSSTKPLNLSIKGAYTALPPKKIIFECSGNEYESPSAQIPFEPKEKNAKVIFKDLIDNPKGSSNISISSAQDYYYWNPYNQCVGTICAGLTDQNCDNSNGYCYWDYMESKCVVSYSDYTCGWLEAWNEGCIQAGCSLGGLLYNEYGDPTISVGSSVSIYCVPGQTIHAEIEEDVTAKLEFIDQLSLGEYEQKTFLLKNYSCYSFQKLYEKVNAVLNIGSDYSYSLYCNRGNSYASASQYHYYWWDSEEYYDPENMLIYKDTVCTLYSSEGTSTPILFNC